MPEDINSFCGLIGEKSTMGATWSTQPPRQQVWFQQGSFVDVADPHIVRPPVLDATNTTTSSAAGGNNGGRVGMFYDANASGSLSPAVQSMAGSYPFGAIYPNAAQYYPSVPGKTDIQFGYRPFF